MKVIVEWADGMLGSVFEKVSSIEFINSGNLAKPLAADRYATVLFLNPIAVRSVLTQEDPSATWQAGRPAALATARRAWL